MIKQMEKKILLQEIEYKYKLTLLRIKYAKRFIDAFALMILERSLLCQYQIIRNQPMLPTGGIAEVGSNLKPEIIIKK